MKPPLRHHRMRHYLMRWTMAGLLALAASGCVGAPPSAHARDKPMAEARTRSLSERIAAEIGNASCDNSQQCRTLPYGHKACGGPEKFVPYSTKGTDTARLTQLAKELADERRAQDQREGMMSTCSIVLDPGAACNAGRCVLLGGQGGALPER